MTYLEQIEKKLSKLLAQFEEKKHLPSYRIKLAVLIQEKKRIERELARLSNKESVD